ncbi:ATP-binding cassette domain-containing protein [Clostridium sp. UBA6640]|uniref:ATP-binding cassette domain-containing protein n=1 Tax=Clostridium sp. UBA6640 TaxID=1946370 RepID=UPI0025C53BFC|nr:ABC transporter ATP-binding protein [Clostridium sp. UBA6640]
MKKYINKIKWYILIGIIFDALYTLTIAIVPYMQKLLFDNALNEGIGWVLKLSLLYFIFMILGLIFLYVSERCAWKRSIIFETELKKDFFQSISRYSYKRFSQRDIGEYISMQGNDITALEQDYLQPLISIVQSINMLIIYSVIMFVFVDFRIALVIFLSSLVSVFVPKITAKTLAKRRNEYLVQVGRYVSCIKDFFEGFKLIDNRTRNNICKEHDKIIKETADKRYEYGKFKVVTLKVNGFAIDIIGIFSFIAVGILFFKNEITIGTGIATFGYIQCFINPIDEILRDINTISSLKHVKSKVFTYINENEPSNKVDKGEFNSHIEFKNISIDYGDFSISDFSYRFEKGKKYALVGHSGSGKSTIVNALMKYRELDSGNIYIDGENLNSLDTSSIICCVNQSEHIFADNFINNASVFSSYNNTKISEIVDNLNLNILKNIKYKENCQQLSGGEKQIVNIVRMLSADTPICIMDESFSAMDVNTTEVLQNTLMNMKDKTVIMVTHKLSQEQLEQFDEVILMKSGKVMQSGAYSDILKTPEFRKLQTIS